MCAQCSSGLAHQMDPHLSSSTEMPDPGSGRRTPGTAWRSLVSAYRSGRSGHEGAIFPPPTMILNLMDLVRHDDPVPGLTEQPHPAARDRAKPRSAAQGCRLQARVAGHGTPHPGEIIQIELRPVFQEIHDPRIRCHHSVPDPSYRQETELPLKEIRVLHPKWCPVPFF
jgi:hypothetical protein